VQLKLNELLAASKGAVNRLTDIEHLTGEAMEAIKNFYISLSNLAKEYSGY
jgi:Low affinity iron permease